MSSKFSGPVSRFAWSTNDALLAVCSGFDVCSIFQPASGRCLSKLCLTTCINDILFLDEQNLVVATLNTLQHLILDDCGILQNPGRPFGLGPSDNIDSMIFDRVRRKLFVTTRPGSLITIDYSSGPDMCHFQSALPLHESLFSCCLLPEPGVIITAGVDGTIVINPDPVNILDELLCKDGDAMELISSSELNALKSANQQMEHKVNLLESTAKQEIELSHRTHLDDVENIRRNMSALLDQKEEIISQLQTELDHSRMIHANQMDAERSMLEEKYGRIISDLEARISQLNKDAAHREHYFRGILTQHNQETETVEGHHKNAVRILQSQLESANASAVSITNQMDRTLKETISDYEETLNQFEEDRELEINENLIESKRALLSKDEQLTKTLADICSLNQRIDAVKLESENKTFQIDTLEAEIKSLMAQIDGLKDELNESQQVLRRRETQLGHISQDIAKVSTERAALLSANVLLKQKLIDLEDHQKAYPGCIQELNDKIESMDQELVSGNKSVQEMKRLSKTREEVLFKLKQTASHLEKSYCLRKRQYFTLANEIRALVEEVHEDKWPQELREIYKVYKLDRIPPLTQDDRLRESTTNEEQEELLRQRGQLTRTVESLLKNFSSEKSYNKSEQGKRIKENQELLREIHDLRKKLIVKDTTLKRLQSQPERRPPPRPKSSLPKQEKISRSKQGILSHQNAELAHRNERLEEELESAQHQIAETVFHRNKLQEALVIALSWAESGAKQHVADFLQKEMEEPVDQTLFRKRVILPRSASSSQLDRRYILARKRPQSTTMVNYKIPLESNPKCINL